MERSATVAAPARRIAEETANQLTHGFGLVLSVIGGVVLMSAVLANQDFWQMVGCGIYSTCLVALYAASTLSHSVRRPDLKSLFQTLDQVCIFLLIAGSFTPFALVHLRDDYWWTMLAAMWMLSLIGIAYRLLGGGRRVATVFYVLLGWLPVFTVGRIIHVTGLIGLCLVLAGGLSYTAGTFFLSADDRYPYFHAIWHVLVITGSVFHFLFLFVFVATWSAAAL